MELEEFDLQKEILEITDPKALRIIMYLLKKIEVLEEKVARLEKNSSNSSKPPSSDITKPESEQRQPGKRKIGGQPKHAGKTRELFPPEKVTDVKELKLEENNCRSCGSCFTGNEKQKVLIQQTVELIENPIEVTEYRRDGCKCNKCGVTTYAPLPVGVVEDELFGSRLQALLSYMKGNHGASYTDLQQFCQDVLGFEVSRGTLCAMIKRISMSLETPYTELSSYIQTVESINIDESGWKDSGSRYWVWVFCTKLVALFSIEKSRGCTVLNTILGEAFAGGITSDFYGAYVSYASENQQFCLAHLIRDIKFLTTLPSEQEKSFGENTLHYFRMLFEFWHERGKNFSQDTFIRKCEKLQRKLFTFLTNATTLQKDTASLTMKKRIIRTWDSLFRFIEDPHLYHPTNNLAEQTIRAVVRIRNNTQGTRSEWGRIWNSRIFSVLATCKKQKRSAFHFILDSINARSFNGIYPSLLPT